MKVRNLRLALGLFFAAMAALLFLRNEIAPELAAKFRTQRLLIGAWFALILAGDKLPGQERGRPRAPLHNLGRNVRWNLPRGGSTDRSGPA